MAISKTVPAIKHDQPIILKVTGARDESGGSGVRSYSIYYAAVASGLTAPEVEDAILLTKIDDLTSIPSTLDPAGETTSGYPSWEASESVSGLIRDHYHWDHVFTYEFDSWIGGYDYYFWTSATDFDGNSSALASGVHPSNPIATNTVDERAISSTFLTPKESVSTGNLLLLTGKGILTGHWHFDGVETVTVPANSSMLIVKPDQSGVCEKTFTTGNITVSGVTSYPYIMYTTVTDFESDESVSIEFIDSDLFHTLGDYDIIVGTIDRDGGVANAGAITVFHGGKVKYNHNSTWMFNLDADTHTIYLKVDGTRAMTGTLDMGNYPITNVSGIDGVLDMNGNNITNVGTVDGVDVGDLNGGYIYCDSPGVSSTTYKTANDATGSWVSELTVPYIHRTGIGTIHAAAEGYVSSGTGNWRVNVGPTSGTTIDVTNTGTYARLDDASCGTGSLLVGTMYDIIIQIKSPAGQTIYFRKPVVWAEAPT